MKRAKRDEKDPAASDMLRDAGLRLQAARKALGLSVEQMAAELGVGRTTLQNWFTGVGKQDWLALTRLQLRHGVTIEFVTVGLLRSVPFELAARLMAACKDFGAPVAVGSIPPDETVSAALRLVTEDPPEAMVEPPPRKMVLHER